MNILLINHYAGSLRHGMEYRPYYLAREWTRMGHKVRVVAASQSHVRTHQPEVTQSRKDEVVEGIEYTWLRTPAYRGNGVWRALNMLTFVWRLWQWSIALVQETKPDVVIASSTHPLDIYPARRIANHAKAKLIFEVHDLWPLSPIELGGISPSHPFMRLLQHAENYAYRHADTVVSMLPNAKEHMIAHGMHPEKFVHIPNGIDVTEWTGDIVALPKKHQATIDELKRENKFIVGYAGAHGVANALDAVVRAGALVDDASICFVLVGQGPEREKLIRQVEELNLQNVVFLPGVPKMAIPSLLIQFDALYIGLQRQSLFRFGISPNKLMDYMMVGKPIIQAIEAGNDPVKDARCGYTIEPENPAAIVAAVKELKALPKEKQEQMGENGRTYVKHHHDYRILAKHFIDASN